MTTEDEKYSQFMNETLNSFDVEHVGHVYILGSTLGFYKIGLTTNLYKRFTNFGVKLPFDVWLENTKVYFDCAWAEKYWHYKFEDKRVNGEWFKLNEFDLDRFHYTPGDLSTDVKLTCLYSNSGAQFWESDPAKNILENYNLRVAYKKAALKDYLDFHLTQPEIIRQYHVNKTMKYNAIIAAPSEQGNSPKEDNLYAIGL